MNTWTTQAGVYLEQIKLLKKRIQELETENEVLKKSAKDPLG